MNSKRKEHIMLTRAETIQGYKLSGVDGDVGKVKEFYFDDSFWTVRYLIADTGGWLSQRQVLISPYFIENVNYDRELIDVSLTKDEIENSPPLESDQPISRAFEESYYGHYGAPVPYTGPYVWGTYPYVQRDRRLWSSVPSVPTSQQEITWDPNLRSTKDVSKHSIQATDGEIGHVADFIIDDQNWEIRYLVIDTKKWLPGKKVLIAPQWIDEISWSEEKVSVQLTRSAIELAPGYNQDDLITRDFESRLYQYYDKKGYWAEEPASREYRF
jgi:hypothetical protein